MHPSSAAADDNPFIAMHVEALQRQGVDLIPFSWKRLVLGSYDILYLHWPENLLRGGSRASRLLRSALFTLTLLRNRFRQLVHVQTIHNLAPHERGGILERHLLKSWERSLGGVILLNDASVSFDSSVPTVTIPHGNYFPFLRSLKTQVRAPIAWAESARLLTFGLLRPYKNLEQLLEASAQMPHTLVLAGAPINVEYGQELLRRRPLGSSASLTLRKLPAEELAERLSECDIVCLPYASVYNSGAILLALSAGRPVITTTSSSTRRLQAEVSESWMQLLPVKWSNSDLCEAISSLKASVAERASLPDPLSNERDWRLVGRRHREFFDSLHEQGDPISSGAARAATIP